MGLESPTEQNLTIMLDELADMLGVVNREIMDPADYDLNKYDDLKFMYDMIKQKGGRLSTSETQAFIDELKLVRK